jgi:plastocyanin
MENREDPARTHRPFGWRTLLVLGTVTAIAGLLLPMLFQDVQTFVLAMAAPFVIGLVVYWRWPRVGAVILGVVSIGTLVVTIPFAIEPLGHPEAASDFVPLVALVVGALVAAIAAWPARREGTTGGGSRAPTVLGGVAAAVIVIAAVASAVAASGVKDVAAEPGDLEVTEQDIAFHPARVDADATTVAIHLTNRDATRHTFTIDELGVDVSIAPNSTARVTFDAGPGSYRFYCRPHAPSMEGTLVVAPPD